MNAQGVRGSAMGGTFVCKRAHDDTSSRHEWRAHPSHALNRNFTGRDFFPVGLFIYGIVAPDGRTGHTRDPV